MTKKIKNLGWRCGCGATFVIYGPKSITDFLQELLGFCKKTQKNFIYGKINSNDRVTRR